MIAQRALVGLRSFGNSLFCQPLPSFPKTRHRDQSSALFQQVCSSPWSLQGHAQQSGEMWGACSFRHPLSRAHGITPWEVCVFYQGEFFMPSLLNCGIQKALFFVKWILLSVKQVGRCEDLHLVVIVTVLVFSE